MKLDEVLRRNNTEVRRQASGDRIQIFVKLNEKDIIQDVKVILLSGTDIMSHFPEASLSDRNASIDEIQGWYAQLD